MISGMELTVGLGASCIGRGIPTRAIGRGFNPQFPFPGFGRFY
jgi:hypothetical protein